MPMPSTDTRSADASDLMSGLRGLLLDRLAEHAAQVDASRAKSDELIGQSDTDSLLERELAEASAAQLAGVLEEVRQALRRMDDGTYGTCEVCESPIPFERLEAIPHARRCVACPAAPTGFLR
jgi:RNA polymerase-binding transcription factor DksA